MSLSKYTPWLTKLELNIQWNIIDTIGLTMVGWIFLLELPSIFLRFLYMSGDSLFYLVEAVQNPNVSNFWRDEAERKEKCFYSTHRCKSLNCFKPSVTWGEELFYIWKQRLEASNTSDKKSWKLLSYLAVCSISRNQSLCFAVLARRPRTSVKTVVSEKFVKFFVSVCMICPAEWVPQSLQIVENTF